MAITLSAPSNFELNLETSSKNSKPVQYSLKHSDFNSRVIHDDARHKPSIPEKPYLIIGFDTEFQTPDHNFSNEEIRNKEGKYKVLSYQFHVIYYDDTVNTETNTQ